MKSSSQQSLKVFDDIIFYRPVFGRHDIPVARLLRVGPLAAGQRIGGRQFPAEQDQDCQDPGDQNTLRLHARRNYAR